MKEIILKVRNLTVELDGEKIIYNLNFSLKQGEIITILGPNGAGKTVLLKTLIGIFPYKGKIEWKKGIKIGYVPQRVPYFREVPITVNDFLNLKKFKKEDFQRLIKIFEIEELLNKKLGILSSGEFQKVLIVWSLLGKPDVLLFDEPTTGIDEKSKKSIYEILKELKEKEKLSIILVTHDLSVVSKITDYVICLNKCPICQGKPREVLNPKNLEKLYATELKFYKHYHGH